MSAPGVQVVPRPGSYECPPHCSSCTDPLLVADSSLLPVPIHLRYVCHVAQTIAHGCCIKGCVRKRQLQRITLHPVHCCSAQARLVCCCCRLPLPSVLQGHTGTSWQHTREGTRSRQCRRPGSDAACKVLGAGSLQVTDMACQVRCHQPPQHAPWSDSDAQAPDQGAPRDARTSTSPSH